MNMYPQDRRSSAARDQCVAAFMNRNSGERGAAAFVFEQLCACLGEDHVFDLFPTPGKPPAIEEAKAFLLRMRPDMVIVAGGDGTVSIGMEIADSLRAEGKIGKYECPVAVLPMGTGNDLSRSLGFGGGYAKPLRDPEKKFAKRIEKIKGARQKLVDRFRCDIYVAPAADSGSDEDGAEEERITVASEAAPSTAHQQGADAKAERHGHKSTAAADEEEASGAKSAAEAGEQFTVKEAANLSPMEEKEDERAAGYALPRGGKKVFSKPFMNYFSVGFDADIASDFSNFRDKHPKACSSRVLNKMWYFFFGIKAMVSSSRFPKRRVSLRIAEEHMKITSKAEAIVVSNMLTYAGGAVLWRDGKKKFPAPAVDDEKAEVCVLNGVMHMVGVGANTRSARKMGQGSRIRIRVPASFLMQYDGESIPALGDETQDCIIFITHIGQSLGMELPRDKPVPEEEDDEEGEEGDDREQPLQNMENPMQIESQEAVSPR